MMKISTLFLACWLMLLPGLSAQVDVQLPDKNQEKDSIDVFGQLKMYSPGITDPPESPVRAMAEWEELQAIAIAYNRSEWADGHLQTLRDIARAAVEEVEVIVICELERDMDDFIEEDIDVSNMTFIPVGLNNIEQIWIRDYGPHTMYTHDVDSMLLVDWIYETESPNSDTLASYEVAEYYEIPLYLTTEAPLNLRLDGGNFLTDGMGTAFSSKRVLAENGNNEQFVNQVMNQFMGIDTYVKFDELDHDVIHHIDMHMKLLDEETILVGQYPEGVSDYDIIESNIAFLEENYNSPFGTPYKIERILMPPDQNGQYPEGQTEDFCSAAYFSACYNTYTNALFVNKKILVPTYEMPEFDNQALEVWQDLMPGYEIVGINCKEVIPYFGAVHCISKEIGSNDPLWIVHQKVDEACISDSEYRFEVTAKHRSGVQNIQFYYKTALAAEYEVLPMEQLSEELWEIEIDALPEGTTVYYYVEATANSGKIIQRPLAAPQGYWHFTVEDCLSTSIHELTSHSIQLKESFPNPASDQLWIPVESDNSAVISISINDVLGREVSKVFEGKSAVGLNKYPVDLSHFSSGTYFISLRSDSGTQTKKIIIE